MIFSVYVPVSRAHEEEKKGEKPHHHHPHSHEDRYPPHQHEGPKGLTPEKAAWFIKKWESPKRDKWQLPDKIIEELGIKQGQIIADIGSGGGYFTVRFSKVVGEKGKVYAVDVEKLYLEHIYKRIKEENISNMELVHAELNNPLLPKEFVDLIFLCNAWHHVKGRDGYIWKIYQALKPEGKMVVIEFRYQQPEIKLVNLDHRIPRNQTLKLAQEGGFKLHGEYFFLPRQYFLIFKKVLFPQN
jgi:ubiquinone/menaquinone biosynthesis C-methylase UbiE